MTFTSDTNLWAVAGMVYALAGAALICNAVFLIPPPTRSATERKRPEQLRTQSAQWLDMRLGAALLVFGFFLQSTGTLGTATLNKPAIFVLLGLAFAASYYAMMKDLLVEKLVESGEVPVQEAAPLALPQRDVAPPHIVRMPSEQSPNVVDLRASVAAAD